ncbi:MAG: UvrB/UvrC motif-containing protein [bacterium]|nr:UvrB/UvrC motif-containing protein [bacterium]
MKFRYIAKKNINPIPKTAGVYTFLGGKEILYIGKAANLRDRVKNHFAKASYRDNLFISQVTRVGYFETQSEIDALLLESQLIKSHQPKYNVMWKDDKKYFYVAITKEKFPRVFLTHQPFLPKRFLPKRGLGMPKPRLGTSLGTSRLDTNLNFNYIGPFVEGKAIKQVLRLLRRAFPYYTAKKHPILPCPYCHIDLCPGPNPNPKEYKQNIKNLAAVLRGGRTSVLKNLKKSMAQASKEQDFEKAAVLRDQIFSLENVLSHAVRWQPSQDVPLPKPWSGYTRIEAYDISNIQGKQSTGSMVTFLKGKPAKEWYRKFKIHITGKPNDFAMMQELISRRLKHTEWPYPDLMLIDGGKGQLSSALKAISNLMELSYPHLNEIKLQKIKVVALAKRNNELFSPGKADPVLLRNLPQEVSNLLLHVRDEAHRFAVTYHRKLRKVDALKSS